MVIDMNDSALGTIAQLRAFLEGTLPVSFAPFADDDARYAHIASVVRRFGYAGLYKPDKGVVLRYLTRLLARVLEGVPLGKRYRAPAHAFARRYTPADVDLLVAVDRAHGCLSGPATAHLLRRAWHVHGDARFERLAQLSSSHLYNLRKTRQYQAARVSFTKTRAVVNAIGERRAPNPQGQVGFHPHRLGAPGRSGRHQGGLSHQCRGYPHPVGGGGQLRAHQRGLSAAGA